MPSEQQRTHHHKTDNMNTIIAHLTDEELTNLGRAMERSGYTSVEEYFRDSLLERVRAALAEKAANKQD